MAEKDDRTIRYLVHFDDGGSGMRLFTSTISVGDEITDGGETYVVTIVEPATSMQGFGHIEAQRAEGKLRRGR